ncbi:MAG: type II/IV secretion system ATPase subunit [Candidatus Woesearchaeota archaeon]|nr:MAG: type II/IV secretion system ATPase subunit [Candidatus Woesearchaeota archaeon]
MLFTKKIPPGGYEIVHEGEQDIMRVNYEQNMRVPSIESDSACMSFVMDKLVEVPSTSRIVFHQRRDYSYNYEQTQMLVEIATFYNHLLKQKNLLALVPGAVGRDFEGFMNNVRYVILNLLKTDPLGAYVEVKRLIREERIKLRKERSTLTRKNIEKKIIFLHWLFNSLDQLKLINVAKHYLDGYRLGERSLYKRFFRPTISPDFMFTRLMSTAPTNADEIDYYKVDRLTTVTIYKVQNDIKYLYHVNPPEFKLSEDKYELLDLAKNVLAEHKPREEEFIDPERMRQTFFNIGTDLIQELADHKGVKLNLSEIKQLAGILVRYTVGFGLIEVLLRDSKVQDITINGPIGMTPIFIVHEDYGECFTNIFPAREDGDGWVTKFRLLSGRPLDEANPVLDTELVVPGARARVAIIGNPLNPWGLGFAFRRHRDKPWTLPLFMHNKMITPLGAGLLSFLVDGARTMLVAGTRSSGKTSLLGSLLVEIMRKYRVITIEDTLELPTEALSKLGYNIQPMKVRSALAISGTSETAADEGIRTSLRMGDSSLIIGEVRSTEAKALYEAMRVGALANVVAGTIHGDSPYGVFDRVVNDLGVPRTSFKATDIIVVANPIKSSDGLHKWRRITQITEVRKHWQDDPLREKGFVDLMKYDSKEDKLLPTDDLLNGDSEVLKGIAGNVKEWVGNWDAVWDNILLRANIKEELTRVALANKQLDLLEAEGVIASNDALHNISDAVRNEVGYLDTKRIFGEWADWLKKYVREKKGG